MQHAWLRRWQLDPQSPAQAAQTAQPSTHHQARDHYVCSRCGRSYKFLPSLRNHQKLECGMEPQFACPHCVYRAKRKHHLDSHLRTQHAQPKAQPPRSA